LKWKLIVEINQYSCNTWIGHENHSYRKHFADLTIRHKSKNTCYNLLTKHFWMFKNMDHITIKGNMEIPLIVIGSLLFRKSLRIGCYTWPKNYSNKFDFFDTTTKLHALRCYQILQLKSGTIQQSTLAVGKPVASFTSR